MTGRLVVGWSMRSAIIQNGYRPDDASQGWNYLRIIRLTISEKPDIFGELQFPSSLVQEAQSVLGRPGDPRRAAFHQHSPQAIELLNCCGPALEVAVDAIKYSDQAIRAALKSIPRPR